MTEEKVRCHWCGQPFTGQEFYPACSEGHQIKLKGDTGQAVYLAKRAKIKLWVKFVNHNYAAWSALFELITGFKPPKMKDIAALISGH